MAQTSIMPKFEPGAGSGLSPGGVGSGPPPEPVVREVRDGLGTLHATVTLAASGIQEIALEDACPAALKDLLLTIGRRGVLYQVDADAAPPGYAREPLTAWNPGRFDEAIAEYKKGAGGPGPAPEAGEAWPVGSVFIAVVPTSPATLLGYGTWAAIGAGRVLVGRDAGDADFDTAEEAGGAKTHAHGAGTLAASAHAGAAVADHASHTHTYTQVPNHVHGLSTVLRSAVTGAVTTQVARTTDTSSTADTALKTDNPDGGVASGTTAGPNAPLAHSVTQPADHTLSGTSAAANSMPPYLVVHMWKRTA